LTDGNTDMALMNKEQTSVTGVTTGSPVKKDNKRDRYIIWVARKSSYVGIRKKVLLPSLSISSYASQGYMVYERT